MQGKSFSVVIIAKNELPNLERSLPPLTRVSNDVIVIDSQSNDGTEAFCASLGVRVVQLPWEGFSATKNAAHAFAKHDWILSIDADEVLSETLEQQLKGLVLVPNSVYALDRMTNYCGTWVKYSNWYPDWKIRLFEKEKAHWEGKFVHEELVVSSPFEEVRLEGKLWHYSYKDKEDHYQRMDKYARLAALSMIDKGKHPSWLKRKLSPWFRFFKTWVLKKGILDGKVGWQIAKGNVWLVRKKYNYYETFLQEKQKQNPS